MQKAQRDTLQGLSEKATFKRGADTEAKRDAFELMMGTDFISSLNHMLKDHAPVRFVLLCFISFLWFVFPSERPPLRPSFGSSVANTP